MSLTTVLGRVEVLTPDEQMQLMTYEEVIRMGWQSRLDVGFALGRIRDDRLYKAEFDTFEDYCRGRWQYGRRYVNFVISASQVVRDLGTNSSLPKPDRETQVRSLAGLSAEHARLVWTRAAEMAGTRKITGRIVRDAAEALELLPTAAPSPGRLSTAERRERIKAALDELLTLARQGMAPPSFVVKLEMLSEQIASVFASGQKARRRPAAAG